MFSALGLAFLHFVGFVLFLFRFLNHIYIKFSFGKFLLRKLNDEFCTSSLKVTCQTCEFFKTLMALLEHELFKNIVTRGCILYLWQMEALINI